MTSSEINQHAGLCARISSIIRELGWREAGFYCLARLFSVSTNGYGRLIRYYLVAQPIRPEPHMRMRPSPKTSIAFIDADHPLVASFPRQPAVMAKRFNDRNLCLAAKCGETFSGFLWLAKCQHDEDEVRCCYKLVEPERSVWDFDVYVEPEFRFGRTFARLWDAANSYLAADGIRWSFSRISSFNPDSLRSHARLGIRKICSATFVCLGKLQISIVSVKPFLHISFSESSRPTLALTPPD